MIEAKGGPAGVHRSSAKETGPEAVALRYKGLKEWL